jgi:hypothetical protein
MEFIPRINLNLIKFFLMLPSLRGGSSFSDTLMSIFSWIHINRTHGFTQKDTNYIKHTPPRRLGRVHNMAKTSVQTLPTGGQGELL